jgi:hypothetical protein
MTKESKGRGRAIAGFLLVLILWLPTVLHGALGFIRPVNAQAVGFDLAAGFVWLLFAFVTWRLFSAFRNGV